MKKDQFEVLIEEKHGVDTHYEIPASLAHTLSPGELVTLKTPIILVLARIASPTVVYPIVQKLVDASPEQLEEALKSELCLGEALFWDMATHMHAALEAGFVDHLQQRGHSHESGEQSCHLVARALEDDFSTFENFVKGKTVAAAAGIGDKTCQVFECPLPSQMAQIFTQITCAQLKAALMAPFEKRGYEDHCEITYFENDKVAGFKINRGSRRAMSRVRDTEKKTRYRDDQKLNDDTIYFIKDTNSLWITSKWVNDPVLYAEVISTLLLGAPTAGVRKSFDLSPFLDKNLGQKLTRVAQAIGVARIEVRFITVRLNPRGMFSLPAGRWESCLTEEYAGLFAIQPANHMQEIKLRFFMDVQGQDYYDLVLKSGSIKPDLGLSPLLVDQTMSLLGVWRPYHNA